MTKKVTARRGPLAMSARRRWTLYIVSAGVWLSGGLWLITHYFMQSKDKFGFIKNNPMEHWWIVVHGVFSFATVWFFGLLWSVHVTSGWWMHWRRWSGGWLTGVTMFLTLTGVALYYVAGDITREWTSLSHWIVGLAALALFIIHRISKSAPRVKRAARSTTAAAE